jgi:hypothetical protein
MGDWKEQSIKRDRGRSATPRTFKCSRCAIEEEALPSGMDDAKGGTQLKWHAGSVVSRSIPVMGMIQPVATL